MFRAQSKRSYFEIKCQNRATDLQNRSFRSQTSYVVMTLQSLASLYSRQYVARKKRTDTNTVRFLLVACCIQSTYYEFLGGCLCSFIVEAPFYNHSTSICPIYRKRPRQQFKVIHLIIKLLSLHLFLNSI